MATYTFPATDLDRPRNLMACLGTFWNTVYSGRDQILAYTEAMAQAAQQTGLELMELLQSISRFEVPIFHKGTWYPLRLRQSDGQAAQTNWAQYNDGTLYDQTAKYDTALSRDTYAYPLPSGLAGAKLILNRFAEPSLILHNGNDFLLDQDKGVIVFRDDPFSDDRVPRVQLFADGAVADQEALLWVFRGDFDWDTAYRQFGYVLGMRMQSSSGYRDLLNAVFDALTTGCSAKQLTLGVSALTGIPLVLEPTETVVDVTRDAYNTLVITDQHVYKFALTATPVVAVDDVVRAGDALTDALTIQELNQGVAPDWLQAIALGRGMLSTCFYQDLIFQNKDFPLQVITDDPSGFTKLQFPLGGYPLDVDHFFSDMHQRGVDAALLPVDPCDPGATIQWDSVPGDPDTPTRTLRRGTLAHLLDVRANAVGEPTAATLPATINPLQFLIQNVLRHNAFVVRVKAALLGTGALGLQQLRWLKRLCPPHTAMILLVELTPKAEQIGPTMIEEAITTFQGAEPRVDTVPVSMVGESITIRLLSGSCQ